MRDVTGVDAPVVLQVTIVRMIQNEFPEPGVRVADDEYVRRFTLIGLAQVEKVIRGEFSDPLVQVAVLPTSCGPYFGAGLSGIVAGALRRDSQGAPVLQLVSESAYGRERRLKNAGSR